MCRFWSASGDFSNFPPNPRWLEMFFMLSSKVVRDAKISRTIRDKAELLSYIRNGNYSNVVCVMCTQFIKIFIPRLSLCLFARSSAVSSVFPRTSSSTMRQTTKRETTEDEGRTRDGEKKLSSFRLFLMVSDSLSHIHRYLGQQEEAAAVSRMLLKKPFVATYCGWKHESDPKGENGPNLMSFLTLLGFTREMFVCLLEHAWKSESSMNIKIVRIISVVNSKKKSFRKSPESKKKVLWMAIERWEWQRQKLKTRICFWRQIVFLQ